MEKQRINQKILCKRMDELEMAISELNTLEASEINKRLLKIENMLYAAKDTLTSQEAAKKELDEWMRQDHYPVITQNSQSNEV